MKVNFTVRNPSASDLKQWMEISEMGNPELHIPVRSLTNFYSHERIKIYETKFIGTVATYIDFSLKAAQHYISEFEKAVKLQPDEEKRLFEKYRNHHVNKIEENYKYSYLYTDYFKEEWSIDFYSSLANELLHIAYLYNEKLINTLFLLQRVYSHFWTVNELNVMNLKRNSKGVFQFDSFQKEKYMKAALDKEYFLPTSFKVPRYGNVGDVQNEIHGPSYEMDINGTKCKIYTDRLNWFLRGKEIAVCDIKADLEDTVIDGTKYQESYAEGYEKGLIEFDNKYNFEKICPILGIDRYIETLQAIKFNDCKGPLWAPGLEGVRHSHIGILSHKIIRDHGYYAGMYSQIERLMADYEPIKKALSVYPASYVNKTDASAEPAIDEAKRKHIQRESTRKRHEQYKEDVANFQSLEGINRIEAIRLTAKKYKTSVDTVERAIGLRK